MEEKTFKTVRIENFKFGVFKQLINQSLIVNQQLIMEFSPTFIRSGSMPESESLIKYWAIELSNMIELPKKPETENIDEVILDEITDKPFEMPVFEPFDVFILRGDIFKKALGIYNSQVVNIEFTIFENSATGKWQASEFIIQSDIETSSSYGTIKFELSTADLLTIKIGEYAELITMMTPNEKFSEIVLLDTQITEIKRFIKNLNKISPSNISYLIFEVDVENNKLYVKDKTFELTFELMMPNKKIKENFVFNILKTDFLKIGNRTFNIFCGSNVDKTIFMSSNNNAIINCLASNIDNDNIDLSATGGDISDIDSLDISEYLGDDF